MKLSKKGIAFESIVTAILVLLTFLALIPLYSKIVGVASTAVIDEICHTSALANAYGRVPVVEGEVFSLECPRKLVTINFNGDGRNIDVETKAKVGTDDMTFKDEYGSKNAEEVIQKYEFTEKDKNIFAINNAIADQLKQCWDNLGRGELPLFSKWWMPLGYPEDTNPNEGWWKERVEEKFPSYKGSPVNCVICSRIIFNDAAIQYFKDKEISDVMSLAEWTKKNPIVGSKPPVSYFEYLLDDVHVGLFGGENMIYNVNEPYAVVFTRINVMKGTEMWYDVLDILPNYEEEDHPKEVDAIYLWPYSQLGERCTVLYN